MRGVHEQGRLQRLRAVQRALLTFERVRRVFRRCSMRERVLPRRPLHRALKLPARLRSTQAYAQAKAREVAKAGGATHELAADCDFRFAGQPRGLNLRRKQQIRHDLQPSTERAL